MGTRDSLADTAITIADADVDLFDWMASLFSNRSIIRLMLKLTGVNTLSQWDALHASHVIRAFCQHTGAHGPTFTLSRSQQTQLCALNRLWHRCARTPSVQRGTLSYSAFQATLACIPPVPMGVKPSLWKHVHVSQCDTVRAWAIPFLTHGATQLLSLGWTPSVTEHKLSVALSALIRFDDVNRRLHSAAMTTTTPESDTTVDVSSAFANFDDLCGLSIETVDAISKTSGTEHGTTEQQHTGTAAVAPSPTSAAFSIAATLCAVLPQFAQQQQQHHHHHHQRDDNFYGEIPADWRRRMCKRDGPQSPLTEQQRVLLLRMMDQLLDAGIHADSPRLLVDRLRLQTEQEWRDMSVQTFATRFAEGFGINCTHPVIPPRLDKQLMNARKLWLAYGKSGTLAHGTLLVHIMRLPYPPPRGLSCERWCAIHQDSHLRAWLPACLNSVANTLAGNSRVVAPSTARTYMNAAYRILLETTMDQLNEPREAEFHKKLNLVALRSAVYRLHRAPIHPAGTHRAVRCPDARDPALCRWDILFQSLQILVDSLEQFPAGTVAFEESECRIGHPPMLSNFDADATIVDDNDAISSLLCPEQNAADTSVHLDILKPDELRRMWQCVKTPTEGVIFQLLRTTGIRVGALIRLRIRGVTESDGITIRSSIRGFDKNHQSQPAEFFLSDTVKESLALHLEHQRRLRPLFDRNAYVFPGANYIASPGHHMSASAVGRMLWRLASRASIQSAAVHAHAFRKTLATELYAAGNSVLDISRFLHHTSVDVTLKHYIKFSYGDLAEKLTGQIVTWTPPSTESVADVAADVSSTTASPCHSKTVHTEEILDSDHAPKRARLNFAIV